jgi:hypothetical protein
MRAQSTIRGVLALMVAVGALAFGPQTGEAGAYTPGCGAIAIVPGIPPWGFHTGSPGGSSFARGHGDINLEAGTVSGIICQELHSARGSRDITMTVKRHLVYHSHYATMWGYPGNIIKIIVSVVASSDPDCAVGTIGHATLFASYNGVRSDSVQFFFPAACKDQDRLYHGTQVDNQVPPL